MTTVYEEDLSIPSYTSEVSSLSEDSLFLDRLRRGDAEAGRRFVHEYYPRVYRYLLYLTGRRELAEDLAQAGEPRFGARDERQRRGPVPGFLQAWQGLATFEGRSPFRAWLHRIAYREFLQSLLRQRPASSLEDQGELPATQATEVTEAVDLRAIIAKLPLPEREDESQIVPTERNLPIGA